jgi:hypothetical protein
VSLERRHHQKDVSIDKKGIHITQEIWLSEEEFFGSR